MTADDIAGLLLSILILTAFVWGTISTSANRKKRLKDATEAYQAALQGTDKQAALAAGRAYYFNVRYRGSLIGSNRLNPSDEMAIANDIAAMKG